MNTGLKNHTTIIYDGAGHLCNNKENKAQIQHVLMPTCSHIHSTGHTFWKIQDIKMMGYVFLTLLLRCDGLSSRIISCIQSERPEYDSQLVHRIPSHWILKASTDPSPSKWGRLRACDRTGIWHKTICRITMRITIHCGYPSWDVSRRVNHSQTRSAQE